MMESNRVSRCLLVFCLSFLVTTSVVADENTWSVSYKLISEIDGSTLAVTERLFVEVPPDTRTLHLSLPKATDVLYVRNIYGELPYIVDAKGRLEIQNVSAGPPGNSPNEERKEVEIGMASKERVAMKGPVLEYVLVFAPMQNNTAFEHVLKLPAGSSIAMVVPQAKILEEENNGRRSVYWKTDAVAAGRPGPEVFLVRFERKQDGFESSRLWEYAVAAIVLLVAGFAAGRLSFAAFKAYKKRKLVSSLGLLDEKEEKTLSLVVEAGTGGILQSQLLKGTQYTKSNLSKIVSRLASRGLLAKKRNGKIQKITPGPNLPL